MAAGDSRGVCAATDVVKEVQALGGRGAARHPVPALEETSVTAGGFIDVAGGK